MVNLVKNKKILFYAALLFAAVFISGLLTHYDHDLFARLIVGELFVENGVVLTKDFLSYTPTHTWYDHEWGSGVLFYTALKYLKPGGLIYLHAALIFGTCFFLTKIWNLKKHPYPAFLSFSILFLILFARLNASLIRCQLISFFLFSIFLYLLEKGNKKLLWLIPPITIIWNNIHGGVVSGLGLVFLYMTGAILEKKEWRHYLYTLITSTALLVINPYGIEYLNFLFSAATKTRTFIVEWWPVFALIHIKYYLPVYITELAMLSADIYYSVKNKKPEITKYLVIFITLILGTMHVKLLSLSLITIFALCYHNLISLIGKHKFYLKKLEKPLYTIAFLTIFTIPILSFNLPRCDWTTFPLYETEFLRVNNIKGNLFVPFGYGSYVSYKLYPDNLIYMDGRYEEVYHDKEFLKLRDFVLGEMNWKDVLNNYPTEIVMVTKTSPAYSLMQNEQNWLHTFDGRLCGIFIKKELKKDSYIDPHYDKMYYRRTMFLNNNKFSKKIKDGNSVR